MISSIHLFFVQKRVWLCGDPYLGCVIQVTSRMSNIESQNGDLEDYNNISDEIFPHFTTPSMKLSLGLKEFEDSFKF